MNEEVRRLYESIGCPVVRVRSDGLILVCNQAFVDLVNIPREQLVEVSNIEDLVISPNLPLADIVVRPQDPVARSEFTIEIKVRNRSPHRARMTVHNLGPEEEHQSVYTFTDLEEFEEEKPDWLGSADAYKVLFETTGAATILVDENLDILMANSGFERLTGYTKEEMEGKMSALAFILPEDLEMTIDRFRRRVQGEDVPKSLEIRGVSKDGDIKYLLTAVDRIPGTNICVNSFIDIGPLKKTEEILRAREAQYRILFETTGAATFLIEEDMSISLVNKKFTEITGYSKEEVESGMKTVDFLGPEGVKFVRERQRMREQGLQMLERVFEIEALSRSGEARFFLVTSDVLPDTRQVIGSAIDITERKLMENALSERLRFEALLNRITASFIDVVPENIDYKVKEALAMLGKHLQVERTYLLPLSAKEISETLLYDWQRASTETLPEYLSRCQPEVREELLNQLNMEDPLVLNRARSILANDPEIWPVLRSCGIHTFLAIPIPSHGEKHCLCIESLMESVDWSEQDISILKTLAAVLASALDTADSLLQRRQLEAQFQQTQKLESIGVLAGGIAHDFNNILAAIQGNGEMMRDSLDDVDRSGIYLNDLLLACNRAKDLVGQILTFSRKSESEMGPVFLVPVCREAVNFVRASVPSTIEIHARFDVEDAIVFGDATQMNQVVINLCTNAYHALGEKGTLEIRLREATPNDLHRFSGYTPSAESYVVLSVSDTGTGMTEDVRKRIFDPFFTTKEVGKGTGMGLSLVHGIVTNAGGAIHVESELDVGSSFQILLPCKANPNTLPMHIQQPGNLPVGNRERVLLVDDEISIMQVSYRMLCSLNYEVIGYELPSAAYEAFQADPTAFDILVTDLTMPKMTGRELAAKLREIRPELPIILCSGNRQLVKHERDNEIFDFYLQKPFMREDLAFLVRELLDEDR